MVDGEWLLAHGNGVEINAKLSWCAFHSRYESTVVEMQDIDPLQSLNNRPSLVAMPTSYKCLPVGQYDFC